MRSEEEIKQAIAEFEKEKEEHESRLKVIKESKI